MKSFTKENILEIFQEIFIEWIRDKYNVFEKNKTFEELKKYIENEKPEDFYTGQDIGIYLENKSGSLLKVLTPEEYKDFQTKLEHYYIQILNVNSRDEIHSKLESIYTLFDINLRDLDEFLKNLEENLKNKDWFEQQGLEPVNKKEEIYQQIVVVSIEEIFHLWQKYNFFYRFVDKDKLKETFEVLLNLRELDAKEVFEIRDNCKKLIEKILQLIEISLIRKELLSEQKELIYKYLSNYLTFIHGYPGTSKTFTGTLAILIESICKKYTVVPNSFPYNALILAPTYKALEAATENIFKFLFHLESILKQKNIKVNLILPLPSSEAGKNLLEKNPIDNQDIEYKPYMEKSKQVEIHSSFKIFKLKRNDFNTYIGKIINQGDVNLILDLPIGFIDYGMGHARKINDIKLNLIHVEEASQVSILDLAIVALQTEFFKNLIFSNESRKKFYKFTFSGDPYQLKSIFNISDETVKYKKIGTLVNLFTFFLKDFNPEKDNRIFVLKKTLRNPPNIIIPVKDSLYRDIESANTEERGEIILITYNDESINKIKKDLKIDGQKINEFEVEIIRRRIIEKELSRNNYEKICILTLYRKQESLLNQMLKDFLEAYEGIKKFTIGTVDKVQGDTCDLVILSFVSTNPSYIENNYSFILEPARLNVAITRTRKKFIAIMHENMKQLLVSTDLEYLYILLMLFERYKRTFGIEESFEQFLEKYKSWNPNIGGLIFEKLLTHAKEYII